MIFFGLSLLKIIVSTKPAAMLMWITVSGMYSTGEVATLVAELPSMHNTGEFATLAAELPIEPSDRTVWFCSFIYHGYVLTLLTALSPCCSPVIPLIVSPLFPLICERLYSLWS